MNALTMDFYELTMSQSYFNNHMQNKIAYFDVFFRKVPDGASFAIANGISEIVEFVKNFKFSAEDLNYLRSIGTFSADFLSYLENLKFTGDLWSVPSGTVILPNEPVITVRAPIIESQLIETSILLIFNHASLITTKASRIIRSAKGIPVMEFGARRALGESAAVDGALFACEAGAVGTSCTQTAKLFNVTPLGTMAHSYIQSFESEYDAFKNYAQTFPDNCTLLIDTYNTVESGIENAIKVYEDVLKPMGKKLKGVRIDSGDLAYLSKQCRKKLDEAGLYDTGICLSNSLDEYLIESLINQNAPISSFGVGENLITAKSNPVFGGVYKLVALEENGKIIPKIKISDNIEKITNPSFKKIYRIFDNKNEIICDYLCLADEVPSGKLKLISPNIQWKSKEIDNYTIKDLRIKFIENGNLITTLQTPLEIKQKIQAELNQLKDECKRLYNSQTIELYFSEKLMQLKNDLLKAK